MGKRQSDWEELGSVEPYFAVLTDERFLRKNLTDVALRDFFASGERDVEWLLSLAGRSSGALRTALEFGCGVGRLCIPLARRGVRVVGVDIAPSMLAIARESVVAIGVANAEFLPVSALGDLAPATFDLVFSYIAFQHIPPSEGERLVRRLLELAAPDGTALLHFTFGRPGGFLRRALRTLRARSRMIHTLARFVRRERHLPYMQMNEYNRGRLARIFQEGGFPAPAFIATDHGGLRGGILVATRTLG